MDVHLSIEETMPFFILIELVVNPKSPDCVLFSVVCSFSGLRWQLFNPLFRLLLSALNIEN